MLKSSKQFAPPMKSPIEMSKIAASNRLQP